MFLGFVYSSYIFNKFRWTALFWNFFIIFNTRSNNHLTYSLLHILNIKCTFKCLNKNAFYLILKRNKCLMISIFSWCLFWMLYKLIFMQFQKQSKCSYLFSSKSLIIFSSIKKSLCSRTYNHNRPHRFTHVASI